MRVVHPAQTSADLHKRWSLTSLAEYPYEDQPTTVDAAGKIEVSGFHHVGGDYVRSDHDSLTANNLLQSFEDNETIEVVAASRARRRRLSCPRPRTMSPVVIPLTDKLSTALSKPGQLRPVVGQAARAWDQFCSAIQLSRLCQPIWGYCVCSAGMSTV